jgi:hypothetical protein
LDPILTKAEQKCMKNREKLRDNITYVLDLCEIFRGLVPLFKKVARFWPFMKIFQRVEERRVAWRDSLSFSGSQEKLLSFPSMASSLSAFLLPSGLSLSTFLSGLLQTGTVKLQPLTLYQT